jgi:hypothetical protein
MRIAGPEISDLRFQMRMTGWHESAYSRTIGHGVELSLQIGTTTNHHGQRQSDDGQRSGMASMATALT